MYYGLHKIISGGQTGADQGGLLAAKEFGIRTGGTCPRGYETSIGPNPLLSVFGLIPKGTLKSRTIDNIRDSDGTIVFTIDAMSPGSVLTVRTCHTSQKPVISVDLNALFQNNFKFQEIAENISAWVIENEIKILNIAGNRERTKDLTVTMNTMNLLMQAFKILDLDGRIIVIE